MKAILKIRNESLFLHVSAVYTGDARTTSEQHSFQSIERQNNYYYYYYYCYYYQPCCYYYNQPYCYYYNC